jgi:hypothetical protein
MFRTRIPGIITVVLLLSATLWGADVILNEYNAVGGTSFLNGGDSSADDSGGRAADCYFGRVAGNGGDWFELVVIKDHLDMRGWLLDIYDSGALDETLALTTHPIWSDLRSGTIITISEDVPSDISYDPAAGDWWINVQAHNDADGLYIEPSSFPVSSSNWQLRVRNVAQQVVFGPAGEGISPASGIGGTEVFRLEDDPSAGITRDSTDYDDGSDFSTFGAPNRWGVQDVNDLRPAIAPKMATLTVEEPNGGQTFAPGDLVTVRWKSAGTPGPVLVEFSLDDGASWTPVYPPNIGNTGSYKWLVPLVASEAARIRVSGVNRPAVYDESDAPFVIAGTEAVADMSGDGIVGFVDYVIAASTWLD